MKIRFFMILICGLVCLVFRQPALAFEHTQKQGLFRMDVPKEWRWFEYPQDIIVTYPDGKTVAIDIQLIPSRPLTQEEIKKALKEGDDKMVKEGIETHKGTLIDDKEVNIDGVYARRLDFRTVPPNPVYVTYISFFNKGYAITVTYGSEDEKMHSLLDDAMASFKFR